MSLSPHEVKDRQRAEDLKAVLSTPAGRRFVWHLTNIKCGVLAQSYTGDAEQAVYREGRRSVGLDVLGDAQELCPPEYLTMFTEALKEHREEELHKKTAREQAAAKGRDDE